MLAINRLTVRSKLTKEELLRSVNFSVDDGETFGLIGESGSGKSMTSKCIMRLLNSRAFQIQGEIRWKGRDVFSMNAKELADYRGKQISMIPQNPMTAFAPMVKLGKQLEMGFQFSSKEERHNFSRELTNTLASVNLSDAEKIFNSYPDELSGGMLQRVMIALTMLQAPKLIIADEITTAVDAASEYQILNQLEKIKASGVSLLVITHDFGVVAKLCDRVAVMKSGEIIEQGKTHEVLSTPQHDYTKQLMEASILFQEALC